MRPGERCRDARGEGGSELAHFAIAALVNSFRWPLSAPISAIEDTAMSC